MLKRLGGLIGLVPAEREMLSKMSIADVIDAHMRWKLWLQEYVDGRSEEEIDPALACREEQSPAGRWIHRHAVEHYIRYGAFFTVRAKHAQFHLLAGEVVHKVLEGDRAAAAEMMNTRVLKISHEVIHALLELNRQATAET